MEKETLAESSSLSITQHKNVRSPPPVGIWNTHLFQVSTKLWKVLKKVQWKQSKVNKRNHEGKACLVVQNI